MNNLLIGAIIGGAISLYVSLVVGCFFRFRDIVTDLASEVYLLRQRYQSYPHEGSTVDDLWRTTSYVVQSVFQPAIFRMEFESQRAAKQRLGDIMNDIIDRVYKDLEKLKGCESNPSKLPLPEQLRINTVDRFEREKDEYVNRIRSVNPSIRALLFLESIHWNS